MEWIKIPEKNCILTAKYDSSERRKIESMEIENVGVTICLSYYKLVP